MSVKKTTKQSFDRKLECLDELRSASDPAAAIERLRKALQDRNNYVVSKAAAIAAELQLTDLTPDLLAAFDRFLIDAVKTDPQCWAKTAVAKALKNLGHRGPAVFLRGLSHVQMEPVWGGREDSATALRGACALALVDCHLDDLEILTYLADALADAEKPVRIDAAIAIAQLGRPEGAPLLRLKATLGDREPEVTGQCFAALLGLQPRESVDFIGRFLKAKDDDVRMEAAGALAQSREPQAVRLSIEFWRQPLPPEARGALLLSLSASPLPESAEFLLSVVSEGALDLAAAALAALASSRFCSSMRERTAVAVEARGDAEACENLRAGVPPASDKLRGEAQSTTGFPPKRCGSLPNPSSSFRTVPSWPRPDRRARIRRRSTTAS